MLNELDDAYKEATRGNFMTPATDTQIAEYEAAAFAYCEDRGRPDLHERYVRAANAIPQPALIERIHQLEESITRHESRIKEMEPADRFGKMILEMTEALRDAGVSECPAKMSFNEATNAYIAAHARLKAENEELKAKLTTADESITRLQATCHQVVGELAAMTRNRDELANVVKSRDDEIAMLKKTGDDYLAEAVRA